MWEWLEWLSCISHWVCQIVHASTSSKHCSTSLNIYNPSWYNQMYIWKARHLWGMEDFTLMSFSHECLWVVSSFTTSTWKGGFSGGLTNIWGGAVQSVGGGSAAHLNLTHSCFKDNMSPVWLAWRMGEVGKLAHCSCVWVFYTCTFCLSSSLA